MHVLPRLVNLEAAEAVERLQPAWDVYADQTREQKKKRASRLNPPRVPPSFWPHGIVGPNCAKFCSDCMAARKTFVSEVQAADELIQGGHI